MKVRQHIPSFSEAEPEMAEVQTLKELLALPFVKKWQEALGFSHYAFNPAENLLIADRLDAYWVIAHLSGDLSIVQKLPRWSLKVKKTKGKSDG
jgi:hypothetical protein